MSLPKRPIMNRPQRGQVPQQRGQVPPAPPANKLQRTLPKRSRLPKPSDSAVPAPPENLWEDEEESVYDFPGQDNTQEFRVDDTPSFNQGFNNSFDDRDSQEFGFGSDEEDDDFTPEFPLVPAFEEEPSSEDYTTQGDSDYTDSTEEFTFNPDDSFGVEAEDEIFSQEPTGDFDYSEMGLAPMEHDDYVQVEEDSEDDVMIILKSAINEFPKEYHDAIEKFLSLLDNDEVSEIVMNSYDKIGYKRAGRRLITQANFGDVDTYHHFINEILLPLTDTEERIDGTNSLIEGQLTFPSTEPNEAPVVGRTHIMTPPVVTAAKVTIAKKARVQYTLDDMHKSGTMSSNMMNFLKAISHGKATTVISGVSGAGKTTLIEAMSYHFDADDRVVIVEDTPELRVPAGDVVSLTAKSPRPGMDEKDIISMEWLVKATNRMRPDRIIVGECRGGEFTEFLIAANSGADGSMTTIHASTPRLALDKMVTLAMKSATAKNESSVIRDINSTVQIVVQADIVDGKHVISRIEEISSMQNSTGKINSATLFEYERHTQRFIARNQPSDELKFFLEQRGVDVPAVWFR